MEPFFADKIVFERRYDSLLKPSARVTFLIETTNDEIRPLGIDEFDMYIDREL